MKDGKLSQEQKRKINAIISGNYSTDLIEFIEILTEKAYLAGKKDELKWVKEQLNKPTGRVIWK